MFKNPFRYFGYLIITLPCFASASSWDTKPICLSALKPDINNDGIVNYLDLWMVGRSYNLTSDDSRFIQKADTNCDNRIDALDWDYVSQAKYKNYPIQKEVNHFRVSLVKEKDYFVGTNAFVESHIKLNSYSPDLDVYVSPVNIKITQTFAPSKGIELTTPLINKTFHIKSGESFKENFTVAFMPKEAGEYQFTTRVEMKRGKRIFRESSPIVVLSEKKESLNVSGKLSYSQNWCFDKKIKSYVYIHAEVFGKDVADINQVEIWDKDSELHYSFFELAEGIKDNSYNGWYLGARVLVTPEFIKNKLCKSGVLKISSRDHSVTTKPFEFCATELKKHEIVKQLKEGDENISLNQKKSFGMQEKIFDCRHSITLSLAKNFSRQKFEQFLIQIGGKVVLYQPEVDLYFVEPNNPSSRKTWNTLREQIKNHAMIFLNFNYANHTELIDKQYKLETGYKPK